jgi:hypothetical protein
VSIKIIGAGMAGLLAAQMLKHHDPVVYEVQDSLPNNHSAVLRFRSHVVADVLGIPFKKVRMIKAPVPYSNPVADALLYSRKNTGVMRTDRSITDGLVVQDRYIAPSDLIERMAKGVDIRYGLAWPFDTSDKVISTIPMPVLMQRLNYPRMVEFNYSSGTNIRARIRNCDAYVSLMVPDPAAAFSRISITGDELIVEMPMHLATEVNTLISEILEQVCGFAGIEDSDVYDVSVSPQKYSKILPIDEDERRAFIHWSSTEKKRAWHLGRFSTWRPGLLLDDLVNDVRRLDRWISSPSSAGYEMDMNRSKL